MKRTNEHNLTVSNIIAQTLGITFDNEEFSLNGWGDADDYCLLGHDVIVLLECERGQDHPTTNVLKVYPYLEKQGNVHAILIHYFFPQNDAPKNRVALCTFLGAKMEEQFGVRFQYVQLRCKPEEIPQALEAHRKNLMLSIPNWKKPKTKIK